MDDHEPEPIWHYVNPSDLHGQGVFARLYIPKGTTILEYKGKRITSEQADEQPSADPENPYHTFFFALSNGLIIDGAVNGNDARWINHSCDPNCEGHENETGDRVFIVAKRDIQPNEELLYDYALTIDEPITEELKQNYVCWCNAPNCRGTMLALTDEKSSNEHITQDPINAYSDHSTQVPTKLIKESIQQEVQRLRPYIRQEIRRELRFKHRQRIRRARLLKRRLDKTS